MRRSRAWAPIAICLALPISQLGHWLVYVLRFGHEAGIRQSSGAHAYFPAILESSAAMLSGILLGGLLVIGLARFMVGLRNERIPEGGWPVLPLLLLLLGAQLTAFAGQELLEAWVNGAAAPAATTLVGWGVAGQLPVALLAAFSLSWISARVQSALHRIGRGRRVIRLHRPGPRPPVPVLVQVVGHALLSSAPAVFSKRGPPKTSRS